jgi:hypothetical protein
VQNHQSPERPEPRTPDEARGGRIIKGGAIKRILLVSIPLAIIALIIVFLLV